MKKTRMFLTSAYDGQYEYQSPLNFNGAFSNPNFFALLRVFLDECVFKYWGCESFAAYHASKGGIVKACVSDLERMLSDAKDVQIVEIERSNGPFDEPSEFDIRIDGSSVGVMSVLDGYLRFQNHRTNIQKTASWVADGHTRGFASLVAVEIKHDNSSSGDT